MIWSYALAAVGILGIWLAGRKNVWGWAVGCGAQVLWIVYAVTTQQYGFIISAIAYGAVYGYNWRRWRLEAAETPLPITHSGGWTDEAWAAYEALKRGESV